MIKALICLSLATIAGAFSAQAPTKPIQTTDLVSGVVYFYGDGTQKWMWAAACVLRCAAGGDRNG